MPDYCNPNITPHYPDYQYAARIAQRFLRRGWKWMPHNGLYTYYLLLSPDQRRICKISGTAKAGQPDGFPRFARWASRQNSKHLPKFYQVRALKRWNLHLSIAEKLISVSRDVQDRIYDADNFYSFIARSGIETEIARIYYAVRDNDLSLLVGSRVRGLVDTFIKMRQNLGHPTDLHLDNIMLRGDNVVFLDPYSSTFS